MELIVDVGRHNLKLQKLEAQKNAEKQRYYNSKVDHEKQSKTFQARGTRRSQVKFETEETIEHHPATNGSDEWMMILS